MQTGRNVVDIYRRMSELFTGVGQGVANRNPDLGGIHTNDCLFSACLPSPPPSCTEHLAVEIKYEPVV